MYSFEHLLSKEKSLDCPLSLDQHSQALHFYLRFGLKLETLVSPQLLIDGDIPVIAD